MRKFLKRMTGIFLCVAMAAGVYGAIPAYAEGTDTGTDIQAQAAQWPTGPAVQAASAIIMDASTGTVLYEKDADTPRYPASITKIMTTLLALENCNLDEMVHFSATAVYENEGGTSHIARDLDEEMTLEQCLYGIMLESANEMALALAEKTSGSVKKFVELMNARAQQLGCTNTHFNNPNGLPDETHVTTANDMAKIAKAAWQNATCRKFFTTDLYEIPPTNVFTETRYLLNHHKMMAGRDYAYDGVLGGKTGYTNDAGCTLVTYAKRGNSVLVAVVLNSTNGAFPDTTSLLDYGFDHFQRVDLNVDLNPVPTRFLPSEKYLLKNNGNTYPFYYIRHVYVTVPTDTDVSQLTKKQWVLANSVGPKRIKSKYYLNDHMVGYGMQYEKEILSDLLLSTSF